MKMRDLFPSGDQLKSLQDVEATLVRRRGAGTAAGWVAGFAAASEVVLALADWVFGLTEKVAALQPGQMAMFIVLGLAAVIYAILRRTSLLLAETKEPFNYTFWIEPFTAVTGTPGTRLQLKKEDRTCLLHHDLMERLNERIRAPDGEGCGDKSVSMATRTSWHSTLIMAKA